MKILKKLSQNIECYIAVAFLTGMLIVLTANTLLRYIFNFTFPWAEEMAAYGQVWLVYVACAYAVNKDAHVCVDSVIKLYPSKLKVFFLTLGIFIWFCFSIFISYAGIQYVITVFNNGGRAISLPIPMWVIYASIPVGHICLFFRLGAKLIKYIKAMIKGEDPTLDESGPPPEDVFSVIDAQSESHAIEDKKGDEE